MKISLWPCALFTFSALITFPIWLTIISKEDIVSFGVSSNVGNILSLATSYCLRKNSLNKLAFSLKSVVTKLLLATNGGIRGIFLLL